MTTPEHLWPARPKYLRRGTPDAWVNPLTGVETPGVVLDPETSVMLEQRSTPDGLMHPSCGPPTHIDLRDVTARAHAAMAYTSVGAMPPLLAAVVVPGRDGAWDGEGQSAWNILCRMRALDESVTVAEARAALGWAESVAGVSDE